MNKEVPKTYNPADYEDEIYQRWENSGYFNPDKCVADGIADKNAPTYSIMLPPPNITAKLHLGHSAMLGIEDLMIRYHRMKHEQTLWLPGTDHAAIATQNVVEKKLLKEQGLTRHNLGKEKFLEEVWKYLKKTQATILRQTRKMGASMDWSREAFTLDEQRKKAVTKMFIDMYEAGVIYKGERIVNWCPRCHSTLADDEVEYKEQATKLYFFKYSKDFPFTIATTRPETKLGDTAVAVNPKDDRYKKYIGKSYKIDFCGVPLKLKIVADRNVEMEFGAGALGVTPAHSAVDWQMAQENNLEIIKVIDEDGKIHKGFNEFSNKNVIEAREMIVQKLKEQNLLEKEEEINNNLSVCYRCNTPIEPLPSEQWFVAVDKKLERLGNKSLKEKAIEVAKSKEIKFIPERFEKRYLDWMENLRDWCISRQIWFGHQIPVWYCNQENKKTLKHKNTKTQKHKNKREIYVGMKAPEENFNKAILLHAWDSNPNDAFLPWLKTELENKGIEVIVPELPNSKNPNFSEWLKELNKIKSDEKTLVIGRSLGGTLALAAASGGKKIGKLILVCTPLENNAIPNFFEEMGELNLNKIKQNIKETVVFHSSDDPYIKIETSEKISKKLNADLIIIDKAGHFSGTKYLEILEACNLWTQDLDTLDTWFSSGMWTFSTLGWPDNFENGEKIGDLARFHPTQVLETGYEILTLWVSRMIMMSLFAIQEIPFEKVYLHGMILDKNGKKMSKSKGNGIDPIDMIEKFGADAVRLSMLIGNTPGNDARLSEEKIAGFRNFINKLWNIARYIIQMSSIEQININLSTNEQNLKIKHQIQNYKFQINSKFKITNSKFNQMTLADEWILGKMHDLIKQVDEDLENYRFSQAGEKLKEFTLDDLADWYLEISKFEKNEEKNEILFYILENLLKLWHPFIPFITETIWGQLKTTDHKSRMNNLLMIEKWPIQLPITNYQLPVTNDFELIKDIVIAIRNARAENKIEPARKVKAIIYANKKKDLIESQMILIKSLRTGISDLEIKVKGEKISQAIFVAVDEVEIYLLGGIDKEKEKVRLDKEISNLEKMIKAVKNKLDNKEFINKAPADIVKKEKEKLKLWETELKKITSF